MLLLDGISIRVVDDLASIQDEWIELEKISACSLFQNYDWTLAWVNNFEALAKVKTQVILGYDAQSRLQFILPFQIRQKFGVGLLEWLAQAESCYGLGIYREDFTRINPQWINRNIAQILSFLPDYDVINLQNLTTDDDDHPSPFQNFRKFEGANKTYITNLRRDFEPLLADKRGPSSLKSMRKRDRRLYELGEVQFDKGPVQQIKLEELLKFKNQQLAARGIFNVFEPPMPDFLLEASSSQLCNFQIFELKLNSQTISSMYTAVYKNCFYPIIITLSPTGPLQVSPGDVLLRHAIKWACETGLTKVDFSAGNAAFKQIWADQETQLFNYYAAKNLKGLPVALFLMATNAMKRAIKKSDFLNSIFSNWRKKLFGKSVNHGQLGALVFPSQD
jgi:CelD/BcsL family acetyltransferase involved in cellulose biosynthesis